MSHNCISLTGSPQKMYLAFVLRSMEFELLLEIKMLWCWGREKEKCTNGSRTPSSNIEKASKYTSARDESLCINHAIALAWVRVNSLMPLNLLCSYVTRSRADVCVPKLAFRSVCQECVPYFFDSTTNIIWYVFGTDDTLMSINAAKNSLRKSTLRLINGTLWALHFYRAIEIFGRFFNSIWIFMKFILMQNQRELFFICAVHNCHTNYVRVWVTEPTLYLFLGVYMWMMCDRSVAQLNIHAYQ